MSNEAAIDWFARNVHKWPSRDEVAHCWPPSGIGLPEYISLSKDQWLARRAELQNKPSWKDAPEWANWLGQSECGDWEWYGDSIKMPPQAGDLYWHHNGRGSPIGPGEVLGDWRDTLERRPESPEKFQPIISIEENQGQYMQQEEIKQQDNSWFERGELPPVGVECEVRVADRWDPCFMIGFNRKGNAVIEYGSAIVEVDNCNFRPIRTERELAIEEMTAIMKGSTTGLVLFGDGAAKLYDAGYRKEIG